MASANKDGHRNTLQTLILTAVYNKHSEAVRRALDVIQEQKLDEKKSKDGQRDGKQILDFLPQKNAPVDPTYQCHSPLMLACELGDVEMVQLLLEEGASAAFKNKEGLNALHIACNKGTTAVCDILIDKARSQNHFGKRKDLLSDLSILINPKEKRGWTPLMYAVKNDNVEIVMKLMDTENVAYDTKNKKEANVIHIASSVGSVKTLQLLVVDRPPPLIQDQLKELFMATDKKGWNIFHYACSSGVEVSGQCLAQWLLENIPERILNDDEKSVLMKQKTKAGYSPFLKACEYQKLKTVEYLASRDDVDVSDFAKERTGEGEDVRTGEKSALHLAAIHDSHEIARVLVEKGCKMDRIDIEGNTVLHLARKKSSEQVERVILASPGGDKLRQVKNQYGQLSENMEPEDIIPPEIIKRGPEFIERYRRALRHGKEKIPRCGLLFLGEARKGKTSLYKLLVGKEFDPKQESTRGIDNNEVDTVDARLVTMSWKERTEEDQQKERDQLHALAIVSELPEDTKKKQEHLKKFEIQQETELIRRIRDINSKLNREKKPRKPPAPIDHQIFVPAFKEETRNTPPFSSQPPLTVSGSVIPQRPVPPRVEPKPDLVKEKQEKAAKPHSKPKEPAKTISSTPKRAVTDPTPKSKSEVPPQTQRSLSTRTDARNVNYVLKKGIKRERKEPNLLLNVLDFAGQKNYRPMHHCFIRRRSLYIVVFNLQDMKMFLKRKGQPSSSGEDQTNPVEEIRYWLHSIHAHIYPPEETQRDRDEHDRRVLLVGTHRSPGKTDQEIREDDFNDINLVLEEEIIEDDRCANHVRTVSSRYFISVENSLSDPEMSGATQLRKTLTEIKGQLKFLDEVYPLSWLRFESRLIEMKKDPSQSRCLLETEMLKIAQSKGVPVPEDALEFFHDTGNVILLRRASKLFLSSEEAMEISNLVITDPKWLIKVMQIIVELPENYGEITGIELRDLRRNGLVSLQALGKVWSDRNYSIPETEKSLVDERKLSIILQAFCLIHPVMRNSLSSDSEDPADLNKLWFVIPSLLPKPSSQNQIGQNDLSWISFYFDFQKFLPREVYYRLICMFIAEIRKTGKKTPYELSSSLCRFDRICHCKWKIELEALQHRIKISVIISGNSKQKPSDCITQIHERYLKRICEESELQGLKYHGGPLLPCNCPPDKESVYEFVSFDAVDKSEENPTVLECPNCLQIKKMKGCSINSVLDNILLPDDESSASTRAHTGGTSLKECLTIEKLQAHTGLTEADLDRKIDSDNIELIACFFDNVENYIGALGLSEGQKTDIIDLSRRRNTKVAMAEALKLWREPNPFAATFRVLIKILLNLERGDVAAKIAEYLSSPSQK